MFVTIYDPWTTKVRRSLEVFNPNDAPLQAGPGEDWIEGKADPETQVVIDGEIRSRPAAEVEAVETERALTRLRQQRTSMLRETDWTQLPDSGRDRQAWAKYRQALRDLPQNTTDPRNPTWPQKPNE